MEQQLDQTQWLAGQNLSSLDREALDEIIAAGGVSLLTPLTMPNCFAWYSIVSKFSPEIRQNWPKMKALAPAAAVADGDKKPQAERGNKNAQRGQGKQDKKGGNKGAPKKEEAKKPAAEEDDFDPFADDPEADAAAAEAMKKKAEEAKTKKKKAAPIAKSLIIWEVKPWGEETDLNALADKILAIEMDGLSWKTEWKKEPVAYGVFKI